MWIVDLRVVVECKYGCNMKIKMIIVWCVEKINYKKDELISGFCL